MEDQSFEDDWNSDVVEEESDNSVHAPTTVASEPVGILDLDKEENDGPVCVAKFIYSDIVDK